MEIIIKIQPIFTELLSIDFNEFIKTDEFVRLCNELGLTDQYSVAYNKVQAKTKNEWAFLGIDDINYNEVLAELLNAIFADDQIKFTEIVAKMVAAYLPHSYYVPSIVNIRRDLQLLGAIQVELEIIDQSWSIENKNYHKKVTVLKNLLTSRAVGGSANDEHYLALRADLLKQNSFKTLIPEFVIKNNNVYEFWQYIKHAYGSYAERRFFLRNAFEPLLNATSDLKNMVPHHDLIPQVIGINGQFITQEWRKALDRMNDDPEAAITTARSLIEMVCKHILEEKGIKYDDTADLPKLYKHTAALLNLSPDQHTEQLFKQILGGCQTVIEGLGGLRNKLGDAHGKSKSKSKPAARHAALAVNLSGAMCSFLLQTFNHTKEKTTA